MKLITRMKYLEKFKKVNKQQQNKVLKEEKTNKTKQEHEKKDSLFSHNRVCSDTMDRLTASSSFLNVDIS